MPFLTLLWRYRKLAAYVLAAAAIALFALRIAAWHRDAQKLPAAVAKLETERKGRAADRVAIAASVKAAEASAAALAADLGAIRNRFASLPVVAPKTLTVVREVRIPDGQTTCPDSRISPDFRLRFNATGTP